MLRTAAGLLLGAAWMLSAVPVHAESLGRLGPTYPVLEESASKALRMSAKKAAKEAKAAQAAIRKAGYEFLDNLPPIPGITQARANKTRFMDGTYTFESDVRGADGKLLVKAGTRFNMLAQGKLDGLLMILDGREERQVKMLERLLRANYSVQPVLIAGSYTKLSSRFKRQFFYDYGGGISSRFDVKEVPAIIGQDNDRIRIEEVKP
jgi:conjugal transfer pilus assembly protein TraW